MAEPKGFLMVPVGFNPSGDLRALELDASDYLKVALAAWLEGAVDVKGYTGSAWKELLVNASGQAIVVGKGTSEEVNAALLAPARGLVGEHGYVGGAWQKQPLALGYSARVKERVQATSTGAGTTGVNTTAVPAGELHVLNFFGALHSDPVARYMTCVVVGDGVEYNLQDFVSVVTYKTEGFVGMIVLSPGDYLRVVVTGLATGQTVYLNYWGYRVDIDL